MANTIWPFIPFVALRGAQIFFAIIVLGLSAYIVDVDSIFWSPAFCLATALFTLIGAGFLLVTFFIAPAFTAPLITLGIDAFLFLFWLISLAGFANQASLVLNGSVECFGNNYCGSIKGNMAMVVFEFLLFLATLIFSALWFHRERTGKTSGTNPEGGHASAGAISGAPETHGTYPMQQQPAMPNPPQAHVDSTPQPVAYPQDQQYQYQQNQQQQYPSVPVPQGQGGYHHQ